MQAFILAVARAIEVLAWTYSLIVIFRVLTSWFPGAISYPLRRFLEAATEPLLAPVRRGLYRLGLRGTVDLSPFVALVGVHIARSLLVRVLLSLI